MYICIPLLFNLLLALKCFKGRWTKIVVIIDKLFEERITVELAVVSPCKNLCLHTLYMCRSQRYVNDYVIVLQLSKCYKAAIFILCPFTWKKC